MKKQIAGQAQKKKKPRLARHPGLAKAAVPAKVSKAAPPAKGSEAALEKLSEKIEQRWGRELKLEADQLRQEVLDEAATQLETFLNIGAHLLRIRSKAQTQAKSSNEGDLCMAAVAMYAGLAKSTAQHRMRIAARFGSDPKIRDAVLRTGALPSALFYIDQALPNDTNKALAVLKASATKPIAELKLELAAMRYAGSGPALNKKSGGRMVQVPSEPAQAAVFFEKQLAAFSSRTSRAFADRNIDDILRLLDDDQLDAMAPRIAEELTQIESWCAEQRARLDAFLGSEAGDPADPEDDEAEEAPDVVVLADIADAADEDEESQEEEDAGATDPPEPEPEPVVARVKRRRYS